MLVDRAIRICNGIILVGASAGVLVL